MKKIYVVSGTSGRDSYRKIWAVGAFFDEGKARGQIDSAAKRADEIRKEHCETETHKYCNACGVKNEFDEKMIMDFDGVEYYYKTIDILDG